MIVPIIAGENTSSTRVVKALLFWQCVTQKMLTFADVGNDANIFNNSLLGKGLAENPFNIPQSNTINGGFKFPFVVLGDDIFALKKYLMKPFSGRNISDKELVFN